MIDNTTVLSALLPCLLQKFVLFKLFDPVSKKIIIFLVSADEVRLFCRLARTTIQKDDDFLITGHIDFNFRVPNLLSFLAIRVREN